MAASGANLSEGNRWGVLLAVAVVSPTKGETIGIEAAVVSRTAVDLCERDTGRFGLRE